jgi:Protein of unknown function (DUF3574)
MLPCEKSATFRDDASKIDIQPARTWSRQGRRIMLNRRARMVAATPRLSHPIMSRRRRIAAFTALAVIGFGLVGLPSPGSAQGPSCHAPALPMLRVELMFGRNVGDDLAVTEESWASFLASEVVPRFPGFSVVDAAGPRTDKPAANLFVAEPSKIIIIIAPDGPETEQRIAAVEAAYKKQFQQQSVVVASRAVCASF